MDLYGEKEDLVVPSYEEDDYEDPGDFSENITENKTIDQKVNELTSLILDQLEYKLEGTNPPSTKDLKDIYALLQNHKKASGPGGPSTEISEATRGAVIGALQGLKEIADNKIKEIR